MTATEMNLPPEMPAESTVNDGQHVASSPVDVEEEKSYAQGIMTVARITVHPGDGLVIRWARPDVWNTVVSSTGVEKPLYDFLQSVFPDFAQASNTQIYIETDENGLPKLFGINGTNNRCSI